MRERVNQVLEALRHKLGPLPVWAWAVIAGGALYVYRARGAVTGDSSGASSATAGSDTGSNGAGPADPITLGPGEAVYDPNTGTLTGTNPEQQGGGDTGGGNDGGTTDPADPQDPITLNPGQSVYDPNTGKWFTAPGPPDKPKAKKPKKTKRKPKVKRKPPKPVKHPAGHGKPKKPRSHAKLRIPRPGKGRARHTKPSTAKHSGPAPKSPGRARARMPAKVKPIAMRQRPAAAHSAPRVVHRPPAPKRRGRR